MRFLVYFFFIMIFLGIVPLAAQDKLSNAITYSEKDWDPALFTFLEIGPSVLDRNEDFHMAPPSANDDPETKAELDYLQKLSETARDQKTMGYIEVENAASSPMEMFVHEGLLVEDSNMKAMDLLYIANRELKYFTLRYKKQFARARPTQIRPTLTTAISIPRHPAYPSGHGGQAHMTALVLSLLDESSKDVYMQFGHGIGHRREIAGVHYPSDKVAGHKLAEDILAKLMEVPAFQKKLQEAKDSFIKPAPEKMKAAKEAMKELSRPDFEYKPQ